MRFTGKRMRPNLIRETAMRTVRAIHRQTTALTFAALTASGFAIALPASAAIDCNKAKTRSEFAVCESETLLKLDEQLASTYQTAIAANPANKRNLRREQREWPAMRDARCHMSEECLAGEYLLRIEELQTVVAKAAAADGV